MLSRLLWLFLLRHICKTRCLVLGNMCFLLNLRLLKTSFCLRQYTTAVEVRNQFINKRFCEIPGPKHYPVVGTLHKYLPFVGDYNTETLDKNARLNWIRYGPLVREELMPGVTLVHVYAPDDIETVFRHEGRLPERRSHTAMLHYRLSKPNVYNTGGLLSTNGPDWWRLRSAFQKNFTSPQSVKNHITTTDGVVRDFITWIKTERSSSSDDFLPYLNRLFLEVIGLIAFGEKFNSFTPEEQALHSRSSKTILAAFLSNSGIMKLDKGIMWRFIRTPLYRQLANSQDYLEKISNEILLKKMHFFDKNSGDESSCLLESFLNQPNIDLKDINGIMVDILMAAIDTTSYSTSFALYHLARNPESQRRLYEEARDLLPDNETPISNDVLSKASYARNCIKESLRLNPVSIGIGRILQNDIILNDYLIPKGTVIVTQNMTSCRLPQYVRDPLHFRPERWQRNTDHYEVLHPFLSLPFGFGPRSCIARRLAEQNMCIAILRLTIVVRLLVLCVLVLSAPDLVPRRTLPALQREEVHDELGQYALRYVTAEGSVVSERGRLIPSSVDGDHVLAYEGEYTFQGDDGKTYVTKYHADSTGFHVDGDHLPKAPA